MFSKIIKYTLNKNYHSLSKILVNFYGTFKIPIDYNALDFSNALNDAILNGNSAAVKSFLDNGTTINLDVSNSISCLNIAIINKDINTLNVLVNYISYKSTFPKSSYDSNLASLLTAKDLSNKTPLHTAIDMFLMANSQDEKNILKHCIKLIYTNPLFNGNNSQLFNNSWKNTSNYFLDYNQSLLESIENYVIKTQDSELIKFFIDNGLRYIDKAVLCVNPSFYSHSAIIVKFNKPIHFNDSLHDVAGILYSFALKGKTNNSKVTFWDKNMHSLEQIKSFITRCNAYMHRIFFTSSDFLDMAKHPGTTIFECSLVSGSTVKLAVSSVFDTLEKLHHISCLSLSKLSISFKELTSNFENISYLFSLYNDYAINSVATDKISSYSFLNDQLTLELNSKNDGKTIYELIWSHHDNLNLSYTQKLRVIEKFLNLQCLKILKVNNIIPKDSTSFSLDDFDKLSKTSPNDLHDKFYYPETVTFDLNLDPTNFSSRNVVDVALCGYKMMSTLEKFNIKVENYSFLRNNCITTLKRTLSECGYKDHIKRIDKTMNICQKRHPLTVITRLKLLAKKSKQHLEKNHNTEKNSMEK